MNTETKELVDMDSDFFKRMSEPEKEKFEKVPPVLGEAAEKALGGKEKTTVDDPTNPLHQWARIRELEKKVEKMENMLTRIFGSHMLVDGQWIDISKSEYPRHK